MASRVEVLRSHVFPAAQPTAVAHHDDRIPYVLHSRNDQVGSCLVSSLAELAYCRASGFKALMPASQRFDNLPGEGGVPIAFPVYRALAEVVPRHQHERNVAFGFRTIQEAGAALVGSAKADLVSAYDRFVRGSLAGKLATQPGHYIGMHVRLGDVQHAWAADWSYDKTFKYIAHWMSDLAVNPVDMDAYVGYQNELASVRFGRRPWGQAPMETEIIVATLRSVRALHGDLPAVIVGMVPEGHDLRKALPDARFVCGSEWEDMLLLSGAKVACLAHSYLGFVGALFSDPEYTHVYYPMNGMYSCLGLGTRVDRSGWSAFDSSGAVVDPAAWQLWRR